MKESANAFSKKEHNEMIKTMQSDCLMPVMDSHGKVIAVTGSPSKPISPGKYHNQVGKQNRNFEKNNYNNEGDETRNGGINMRNGKD